MKPEPGSGTGVAANEEKNLTPGMRQYREIKAQYPDAILFFHIGDFFETLEGDAEIVSKELDLRYLLPALKMATSAFPSLVSLIMRVKDISRVWLQKDIKWRFVSRLKIQKLQKDW